MTQYKLLSRSNQEQSIILLFRPLVKAYILGYASSTVPRLLNLLVGYLLKLRKKVDIKSREQGEHVISSILRVLRGGLEWQRFPTFCAALVGGSTLLQIPVRHFIESILRNVPQRSQERLTRWLSAFIAAWASLQVLQSKNSESFAGRSFSGAPTERSTKGIERLAGRTLDLTLFALTRAVDVVVGELWARHKRRRQAAKKWTGAEAAISALTDSSLFAVSSALIMWSFIYLPDRLPRAYNKWIAGAASVDDRLLSALRRARWGDLVYGKDTGQAPLLQAMCKDYGWPEIWGDPAKTIPFPCEMVHMGAGSNCEWHAFTRFLKGFTTALEMYGPLNLALQLPNPSPKGLRRAAISSLRSSAFLGAFIALYWYGVCLARTRIGPHIIGTDPKARLQIDSGICIGCGCSICGWSILLESESRRKDIALFVAPRALATLLPRRYKMEYQWRETATFAISTAVVFTCVQENPARVRGVLGKLLASVLGSDAMRKQIMH